MFNISKLEFYGVITAIIIAVAVSYGFMWESSIKKAALEEFNRKQLEQQIKDQQEYIQKMTEVNNIQKQALDDLQKQNIQLKTKVEDLNKYLDSKEVRKNAKPSSDVIKKTLEGIISATPGGTIVNGVMEGIGQ